MQSLEGQLSASEQRLSSVQGTVERLAQDFQVHSNNQLSMQAAACRGLMSVQTGQLGLLFGASQFLQIEHSDQTAVT